jgi:hypothetical protein
MQDKLYLIEYEDLTPDLQLLADVIGMDTTRIILRELAGVYLYIPNISRLERFVLRYLTSNIEKPVKKTANELGVSAQFLWKLKREKINMITQTNTRKKTKSK